MREMTTQVKCLYRESLVVESLKGGKRVTWHYRHLRGSLCHCQHFNGGCGIIVICRSMVDTSRSEVDFGSWRLQKRDRGLHRCSIDFVNNRNKTMSFWFKKDELFTFWSNFIPTETTNQTTNHFPHFPQPKPSSFAT